MPRFSPITLGEKLSSLEIGGLVFTETAHKPNRTLPRHYHERANIAFVLSGSFTEVVDQRRFECAPQSLIIKPAGAAHANQYGRGGMRCLLIEAQPQRLESLYPLADAFGRPGHARGAMLSMLATRIYREMRVMDGASRLAIEGLSLELVAELSRHPDLVSGRKPPRWLEQAKDKLHAHFCESLSLTDIAEAVGVHPVHFARAFRKHFRCTPGEYVRRLRIEFASRALSEGDAPLVEVALAAGFAHQSHFSRIFKARTGMTPSEFRAASRPR